MEIVFSPRKDAINRRSHGISLQRAEDFDLTTALIFPETSQDYGELRYQAIGFLDAKLYVLIFTETDVNIRAISLRKAEKSEERIYAHEY
jgi:uncharacterized DUF497 family protein